MKTKLTGDIATKNNGQLSTPILFIVFNRPDTTEQVFQAIRNIRPAKLYIAADGPRTNKEGEDEKCNETRKITENIDWPCDVFRKYSDKNLGCKMGVSSAISWFFEHEEMGIILEDDCLPHPSFFPFCQELLGKYKDVDEVKMITGDNFFFGKKFGDESYYFSYFQNIWGWATWRRVWNTNDLDMVDLDSYLASKDFKELYNKDMQRHWEKLFRHVKNKKIDTWDTQWSYTVLKASGLTIIPNVNLISNIGFGENATHTKKDDILLSRIPVEEIGELVHPKEIVVNPKVDELLFYSLFYKSFFQKIVIRIKSLLGK